MNIPHQGDLRATIEVIDWLIEDGDITTQSSAMEIINAVRAYINNEEYNAYCERSTATILQDLGYQ